jgi:signal transduction histidine kinase
VSTRPGAKLAWGSLALSTGLSAAAVYLVLTLPASVPTAERPTNTDFTYALLALAFAVLGAFLAPRRDGNRVAWMACVIGLGISLAGFAAVYDLAARYGPADGYPFSQLFLRAGNVGWDVGLGITVSFLPLLFPDGRLLSRRWRPVAWLAGIGIALLALGDSLPPIPGAGGIGGAILSVAFFALLAVTLAIIASLILRYRRADPGERLQLKWFMTAAIVVGVALALQVVLQVLGVTVPGLDIAYSIVLLGLPVSIAIAVLKYRLYEIDVVINRALVYGALAAFITAVYVGIVVGIGALIGSRGQFNLGLSILATAVVALAFQSVRTRVQAVANRLVYGYRATPYEVLTQFSHRVAGTYANEEVLSRLARVLAEGTGATVASVWIRSGNERIPAATWPESALPLAPGPTDRVAQVRHQGETLGELTAKKRPGEPFTSVEEKLFNDLAAQAGQVLRNVRLTSELQARLRQISEQAAELRASRQRIVAAQDAERRRLEGNIHDGAQQHLVALAVNLRLAATLAKRDPANARRSLKELESQTAEALQTLRDLAQGIYPPALRERGLAEALGPHAQVTADGVGRYDSEVEAGVYFCCLEAIQNATKHAKASSVRVNLREQNEQLLFSVIDDGVGFDPKEASAGTGVQNMKDRVASLGGRLSLESQPGGGTIVSGLLPLTAPAGVAS